MKRIMEKSPVVGYQLFRWEKQKVDGTTVTLAKYYVRHLGKDICTKTDRLIAAKNFVKKMASVLENAFPKKWSGKLFPIASTAPGLSGELVREMIDEPSINWNVRSLARAARSNRPEVFGD